MTKMELVFFKSAIVYQDIIKENQNKFSQTFPAHLIHKRLKSSRGIGEVDGHDHKFIMAFICSKRSLGNFFFLSIKRKYYKKEISLKYTRRVQPEKAQTR